MKKEPTATATLEFNPAIPLTSADHESSCFGKEWEVSSSDCNICADQLACQILLRQDVDKRAKKLGDSKGIIYLDETDFGAVTDQALISFINPGETTVKELLAEVLRLANTQDKIAAIEWLKSWITNKRLFKTSNGIVCNR